MDDEFVVKEEFLSRVNRLLLEDNIEKLKKNLVKKYNLVEIFDIISEYSHGSNLFFAAYFNGVKEQIIEIMDMILFLTNDNDLIEEKRELLGNLRSFEKTVSKIDREEALDALLELRMLTRDDLEKPTEELKECYSYDILIFNALNGIEDLPFCVTKDNYFYILSAILYYLNTVMVASDPEYMISKIYQIMDSECHNEITDRMERDICEIINKSYYSDEALEDEEDEEDFDCLCKKESPKEPCRILQFKREE